MTGQQFSERSRANAVAARNEYRDWLLKTFHYHPRYAEIDRGKARMQHDMAISRWKQQIERDYERSKIG